MPELISQKMILTLGIEGYENGKKVTFNNLATKDVTNDKLKAVSEGYGALVDGSVDALSIVATSGVPLV